MGLGADLRRFRGNVLAAQDTLVREAIGQAALSLILKSPVGDPSIWKNKAPKGYVEGRFRANWQIGVGSLNAVTTEDRDVDGGPTLDKIVGSIPTDAAGKVYYLSNSLPYAIPLENGHSTQAPLGMVTLTAIEWPQFVRNAALKVTTINGRSFEGGEG